MIGLEKLLSALRSARVEFILIGGVAARVHGSARVTQDVDIVYGRSNQNIERLVKALAPYNPYLRGAPPGLPFEWSAKAIRSGLNFTLTTSLGAIDLRGEVAGGGTYEDLVGHTVTEALFGNETRIVSLPWLIRLKRAAGRVRDLEAIAELELLQELSKKG